MVRALVLLLVLANLLFFVWAAGYLGTGNEGRVPERLTALLQPDRVLKLHEYAKELLDRGQVDAGARVAALAVEESM